MAFLADSLNLLTEKANAHIGTVWSVDLSPDGSKIVSGSSDKTIKVWDLISWSRQDHMLFNATTRTRVVFLLWLNKQSMQFPDELLDVIIRTSL